MCFILLVINQLMINFFFVITEMVDIVDFRQYDQLRDPAFLNLPDKNSTIFC